MRGDGPVIPFQEMAGFKLMDAAEHRSRIGNIKRLQVLLQRDCVDLHRQARHAKEGFHLRAEVEHALVLRVVERLNAKAGAEEEESFLAPVPESEGKHSIDVLYQAFAVLFIEMHEHF